MEIQWIPISPNEYSFRVNGQERGTLQLNHYHQAASMFLFSAQQTYQIKRVGFWKSKLVILNAAGKEIVKVEPKSWFSSSWSFQHQAESYEIKIDNCPLVEFSIIRNQKKLISYGLKPQKVKLTLGIQVSAEVPELFHFLLWFLMRPIVIEQTGQEAAFVLLTSVI